MALATKVYENAAKERQNESATEETKSDDDKEVKEADVEEE